MFGRFASKIKALPPRGPEWASRLGPAVLMGVDGRIPGSSRCLLNSFSSTSKDSDTYAEIQVQDSPPVELPPDTVAFMPLLNCGEMLADEGKGTPTSNDWYGGVLETSTDLYEKGYVPLLVGGDGSSTVPLLEAYKRVNSNDEVVVMHFCAFAGLSDPDAPLRLVIEKNLAKGIVSIGNRAVDYSSRRVRKAHKVMYMDQHALFMRAYHSLRDLRNEFPVLVSFDFNVIDPALVPAVAKCESGGFTVREVLHFIHGLRGPKLIGVDIHGFSPELDIFRKDGMGISTLAAAKIIKETAVKIYSMSSITQAEGMERLNVMQAQGQVSKSPYPDF